MIQKDKARITVIIILSVLVLMIIAIAWAFTSQTGQQSNNESYKLADYIENFVAKHFRIDRNDLFWRVTLNVILRKAAHFAEYTLMGLALCTLLNVAMLKYEKAALISLVVCMILAMLDEFRQRFVVGRTPRWDDVLIDFSGALLGIILVTLISAVIGKINSLKKRIEELEGKKEA